MSWGDDFVGRVAALCDETREVVPEDTTAAVDAARRRLDEPLRVAIAGRVKAGKSTLLNALVGERLAPTDAGECTRIVTWYREGTGYEVTADLRDGTNRPLSFTRDGGALQIDLGDLNESEVECLEVRWPSSRLRHLTLIDTPGIAGMDEARAARTRRLINGDDGGPSEVDAVIYLMRHLHQQDAAFLETFTDRSVAQPSPVNAVAILSRADEIGAGRLDALTSARSIARRYARDGRVRSLAATVVTVAGLAAETGRTLREDETEDLRVLASLEDAELSALLVSADRFRDPERTSLSFRRRSDLLRRFGMFGLRFAIAALRSGEATTADDLSAKLVEVSGLDQLTTVLDRHLRVRSGVLKARSTLSNLRVVAIDLDVAGDAAGRLILTAIEELEASAHELTELRLTELLLSGEVEMTEDERSEIGRLFSDLPVAERLGVAAETDREQLETAVLARIQEWRRRGSHPLADRSVMEASAIVVRSYEGLHARLENAERQGRA
jgi:hypothetical protein